MNLLYAYDRALTARPLLTKVITSTVLFGLGDIMAQKFEGHAVLDMNRAARMAAWGAMFTPLAHVWYAQLDKFFPGQGAVVLVKKVLADQLTWTPVINSLFFFTTSMMVTPNPALGLQQIQEKLWPTLKVNWVVWPILQGVNLSVVPLQYRILFINFASLFWSAYLSNMANKAAPPAAAAPKLQ